MNHILLVMSYFKAALYITTQIPPKPVILYSCFVGHDCVCMVAVSPLSGTAGLKSCTSLFWTQNPRTLCNEPYNVIIQPPLVV